ncbi:MAG: hypothetical protein O2871_03865 [bacterium]|nr:hypothetical protein [bacterium]
MISEAEQISSLDVNTFFIVETIRLTLKRGGYIFSHNKVLKQIKAVL